MHLPGDRAGLPRAGITKTENFYGPGTQGLRNRHPGGPRGGIGHDLDPAPFARIEYDFGYGCELLASGIVVAPAVIPVSALWHLKLDATQGVQRNLVGLGPRAEDQHTGLMVWTSRDMPHGKHQTKAAIVASGINHSPSGAGAGHCAVFHGPPRRNWRQFRVESIDEEHPVQFNQFPAMRIPLQQLP